MKTCPKCKIEKPFDDFNKNSTKKDGLQRICKKCVKEQDRKLYQKDKAKVQARNQRYTQKVKDWYNELKKTLKCETCSESRYWVLEWHHLDPAEKDFNISDMVLRSYSINSIKEEIKKCICICANCHRDIHFKLKQNI